MVGLRSQDPDTWVGRSMLLALALGAAGDLLLIPGSKRTFLLGLGAFLLAHVAYAAAFLLRGVEGQAVALASVSLVIVAIFVLRWLLPRVHGGMKGPVVAYALVISAMVSLAVGTHTARSAWPLLVGSIAFYLSDLSVARDRFVAPGFVNRLWGLPLYYAAQILLAGSNPNL